MSGSGEPPVLPAHTQVEEGEAPPPLPQAEEEGPLTPLKADEADVVPPPLPPVLADSPPPVPPRALSPDAAATHILTAVEPAPVAAPPAPVAAALPPLPPVPAPAVAPVPAPAAPAEDGASTDAFEFVEDLGGGSAPSVPSQTVDAFEVVDHSASNVVSPASEGSAGATAAPVGVDSFVVVPPVLQAPAAPASTSSDPFEVVAYPSSNDASPLPTVSTPASGTSLADSPTAWVAVAKSAPTAPQSAPVAPQSVPVAPQSAPVVPQRAPIPFQSAPVVPQPAPVLPQSPPKATPLPLAPLTPEAKTDETAFSAPWGAAVVSSTPVSVPAMTRLLPFVVLCVIGRPWLCSLPACA